MRKTFTGSCHCGAVRYEAEIDLAQGPAKCNCTFCMKARSWKVFVKPSSFRLLGGSDNVKGYQKHPQASPKYFCVTCGMRTHELGSADYMGGDFVGIYIASIDNVEPGELIMAPVRYSDGRNNNWQNPPVETRHL